MPLSDREKRLLEEMEAALLTEDPRLVSALSSKGPVSPSRNRIMAGGGLVILGVITLFGLDFPDNTDRNPGLCYRT